MGAIVVVGAALVVEAVVVVAGETAVDEPQAAKRAPVASTAKLPANTPGLRYLREEIAI